MNDPVSVPLSKKIAFLKQALHEAEPPGSPEVTETHMSWVFLTQNRVYKLKKPITLNILDFSTLRDRHWYCMEEVRINRQLGAILTLMLFLYRLLNKENWS